MLVNVTSVVVHWRDYANCKLHDLFTNYLNSSKCTHLIIKSEVCNAFVNPEESFKEGKDYLLPIRDIAVTQLHN